MVLDPVLRSTSGTSLLDTEGVRILKDRLLPLATVITPNVDEAATLSGMEISNVEEVKEAAQLLHAMGAKGVVVTGGHLERAIDVLSMKDQFVQVFRSDRLDSTNTHGTGCAFSTTIACLFAQGRSLSAAVLLAKAYVTAAISNAYPIGRGPGPVNHMYQMKNHPKAVGMVKKLASGKD